jgi:glyoxylase-like metal-dependent hydrolase (beta-lactamase superfamily II)
MLDGRIDGVSPDEGEAAATLAAIRRFAATRPTIYLPTHDPAAARRLERREVVSVEPRD